MLPPSTPAAWERVLDGAYENRGLAQVERLGRQWVLNVFCDGTHSVYVEDTGLDLTKYRGGFVRARYQYVERQTDVQCVQAPCPPATERRAALERVTPVQASADDAQAMARACR